MAGRNLCTLRKARRAPLHPIGEYALLSPHAPTADYHERTALSKRLTRSRELSAQNALVWVRGFRVFRLFLARVRVRWFSFFSFTSSSTYCNAMIVNTFGVKVFAFRLHPLPLTPGLHRTARKVYFSAGLFSKAREYRTDASRQAKNRGNPSAATGRQGEVSTLHKTSHNCIFSSNCALRDENARRSLYRRKQSRNFVQAKRAQRRPRDGRPPRPICSLLSFPP